MDTLGPAILKPHTWARGLEKKWPDGASSAAAASQPDVTFPRPEDALSKLSGEPPPAPAA